MRYKVKRYIVTTIGRSGLPRRAPFLPLGFGSADVLPVEKNVSR